MNSATGSKSEEITMTEKNLPALQPAQNQQNLTAFSGITGFEAAQRMAKALVNSTMVPQDYQGEKNIGNALIALEMSQRIGASPMAVMQNLHVIHGRPSWSSSFIIAALNSCGRFSPLRFDVTGTGDKKACVAWAYDQATGEKLAGPESSIEMAKAEGWYTKNGSKWKTMPDLMLRYRAAAFFGRLYAPDVLMGMHTQEEVEDVGERQVREPAPVLVEPVATATAQPETPPLAAPTAEKPKRQARPAPPAEPEVVEAEPVEEVLPPMEEPPARGETKDLF
jgi:hypothetical protein